MRNTIIIVLLAVTCLMCKSRKIEKKFEVDYLLWETVNQFVEDAENMGVDTDVLKDSLDYVVVMPLSEFLYGVYTPKNKQVSINMFVLKDSIILKKVLYHELGHVLGLEHDKIGIMATRLAPSAIHNQYCPDHNTFGNENWELHKLVFFNKILQIQNK